MFTLGSEERYFLQLANSQAWCITATSEVSSWVRKLASLMELKTCQTNGLPKLIFRKRQADKKCGAALLRSGWKLHDLRVLQFWSHRNTADVICEISTMAGFTLDTIRMFLALLPIYQRAQDSGGLPFHAALVKRNGHGILLAGPGDRGKSTCCQRLPHDWQVLCDDETLIVRSSRGQYLAHPFPTWNDYLKQNCKQTVNVQQYVPVSSIFFLEQANKDDVIPLGQGKAAVFINRLSTQMCRRHWRNLKEEQERALRKKLFDNACELAKTVPAYILRVSLHDRFWEKIEKGLPPL